MDRPVVFDRRRDGECADAQLFTQWRQGVAGIELLEAGQHMILSGSSRLGITRFLSLSRSRSSCV